MVSYRLPAEDQESSWSVLTARFCWRISAAGGKRWWWGPSGWCTWSYPPSQRPPCLWDWWCFRALRLRLPSKRLEWYKAEFCGGTSPTIPVFPLGSRSWLGRLARRISWDQGGGWISLVGLGGKQSMLCVSILKTAHLLGLSSTQQTFILSLFWFSLKSVCWNWLYTSQPGFIVYLDDQEANSPQAKCRKRLPPLFYKNRETCWDKWGYFSSWATCP